MIDSPQPNPAVTPGGHTAEVVSDTSSGLWGWAAELGHTFEDWILSQIESVWIYFGLYGVSFLDAVFPVVPSESVVIALSATWAQTGAPILALVWIAAALGAWTGDQVTYTLGTLINVRRIPGMGSRRGRGMLDWAEHALEHRGTSFIIAARFIPGGRVAVNLTAGALRFPRRRFMGVAAIAAVIWATWGVVLGITAGRAFEDNLLLSISIGVVGGVLLGLLVDKLLARIGIEPPDLPDIDELPERHLTKKGREGERLRQEQIAQQQRAKK